MASCFFLQEFIAENSLITSPYIYIKYVLNSSTDEKKAFGQNIKDTDFYSDYLDMNCKMLSLRNFNFKKISSFQMYLAKNKKSKGPTLHISQNYGISN